MIFCNGTRRKQLPYSQNWSSKFGFAANVSLSFSTNAPHSIKLNRIFLFSFKPNIISVHGRQIFWNKKLISLSFFLLQFPPSISLFLSLFLNLSPFDCVSMVCSTISINLNAISVSVFRLYDFINLSWNVIIYKIDRLAAFVIDFANSLTFTIAILKKMENTERCYTFYSTDKRRMVCSFYNCCVGTFIWNYILWNFRVWWTSTVGRSRRTRHASMESN